MLKWGSAGMLHVITGHYRSRTSMIFSPSSGIHRRGTGRSSPRLHMSSTYAIRKLSIMAFWSLNPVQVLLGVKPLAGFIAWGQLARISPILVIHIVDCQMYSSVFWTCHSRQQNQPNSCVWLFQCDKTEKKSNHNYLISKSFHISLISSEPNTDLQ